MIAALPVVNTAPAAKPLPARPVANTPVRPGDVRISLRSGSAITTTKAPEPVAKSLAVRGEWPRTIISTLESFLAPFVRGKQGLQMLAASTFSNPIGRAFQSGALALGNGIAAIPLLNNPVTRTFVATAGRLFPYINASILAFDGYAAYQTFSNPAASATRKALVAARFTANAIGAVICFIPNRGAVLSMPFSMTAVTLDWVIKWRNAKGKA